MNLAHCAVSLSLSHNSPIPWDCAQIVLSLFVWALSLVLRCHSDLGLMDLCFGRSPGFRGQVGSTERGQRLQKCPGMQDSMCKGVVTGRGEERRGWHYLWANGLCSGPSCDRFLPPAGRTPLSSSVLRVGRLRTQ